MKKVLDSEDGLECDSSCHAWFHIKCIGVTKTEYSHYSNDVNKKWYCHRVDCHSPVSNPSQIIVNKMDELLSKFSTLATKEEVKSMTESLQEIKTNLNSLSNKINLLEPRLDILESEVLDLKKRVPDSIHDSTVESVIEEINDRRRCARNVIIFGLRESESTVPEKKKDHDRGLVERILALCDLKSSLSETRFFRVGKVSKDRPRAVKMCLPSESVAIALFKEFGSRKGSDEGFKDVSLVKDRTVKERKYLSDLRDTLKTRTESGELDLTIKYVNGVPKIVKKN